MWILSIGRNQIYSDISKAMRSRWRVLWWKGTRIALRLLFDDDLWWFSTSELLLGIPRLVSLIHTLSLLLSGIFIQSSRFAQWWWMSDTLNRWWWLSLVHGCSNACFMMRSRCSSKLFQSRNKGFLQGRTIAQTTLANPPCFTTCVRL